MVLFWILALINSIIRDQCAADWTSTKEADDSDTTSSKFKKYGNGNTAEEINEAAKSYTQEQFEGVQRWDHTNGIVEAQSLVSMCCQAAVWKLEFIFGLDA